MASQQRAKTITPYHRNDSTVKTRQPRRTPRGNIQQNGNPDWNASWKDLVSQTPTWVIWQIGTEGAAGPTIDGYEMAGASNAINWTVEILDMTKQRVERHVHAEISIHHSDANGAWGDNSIVEETPAITMTKFGEIPNNTPIADVNYWMSHGCNRVGTKLGSNGMSFNSIVSGSPGYFLGRTTFTGGSDHFKLHLCIADKIFESPLISYA